MQIQNVPERRQRLLLAAQVIIESMLLTLVSVLLRCIRSYELQDLLSRRRICGMWALALAAAALLLGCTLVQNGRFFLKEHPLDETMPPVRGERIWTEVLLTALLVCVVEWGVLSEDWIFAICYLAPFELWDSLFGLCGLLLLLIVFYACLFLLLCQWVHKSMPQTSLFWRWLRRLQGWMRDYRKHTPLEVRLRRSRRGSLLFAGGVTLIGLTTALVTADYLGGGILMLELLSFVVLLWLFWFRGVGGRLTREAGRLAEQIRCMAQGEEPGEDIQLSERAFLYEPSCQLKNIAGAMRSSVEKQMQAERLKVDLITNVSHDLKTPLTSMGGYIDLLKKEELSAEARDYVEVLAAKQEQLKNMIQDLFDLSKATSGADQMELEVLDMRRLMEQTLADMEDLIRSSGRDIRTTFSDGPLPFLGDNNRMYRVAQNLLENALKYSLEGTRIYVEARRADGQVELQIKNIASYEMDFSPDEITERFVRGDKARTTQGHGLGLAIASSFVHNMGGKLVVETDGDLFKVTLRFPEAETGVSASVPD